MPTAGRSVDNAAMTEDANNDGSGANSDAPQKTLVAGTSQTSKPSGPSRTSVQTSTAATPKAKGKTLAGGTPASKRGQYWQKADDGDEEGVVDEVTAEELVEDVPKPPAKPPPKRKSVPAPPMRGSRRAPPKPPGRSVPSPPRKPRPKPPLRSTAPPPQPAQTEDLADKPPASEPPPIAEVAVEEVTRESKPDDKRTSAVPRPPSRPAPPVRPRDPTPEPAIAAPPMPRDMTPSPVPVIDTALAESPPPAPSLEHKPLTEVCRAELALSTKDPVRMARLHMELGDAADDTTEALKHYRLALEKAPDYVPAIRAARQLEIDKRNPKRVAQLFDAEIKIAPDPRARAGLLFAKGCAYIDLDDDLDAARACFAEAAVAAPDDITILKALQHGEQAAKDWNKLVSALELEANAAGADKRHRAVVLTARARLLERRLGKSDEAIEQLELALDLDPHSALAAPELKRLLFDAKRWRELIAALEREAKLTTSDEIRTQAWWNVARVHDDRLQTQPEAIVALENAVRIAPDDAGLLEELTRLYESQGDDGGAASALERLAQALERPNEKVAIFQRLAQLYDRRGGDAKRAVEWYEAALALDATFAPALHALDRLYAEVGNFNALAGIYVAEGQAPGASAKRAAALCRAAAIFDAELGRSDVATAHYARALALDPSHEGAFKSLVRLYTATSSYHELLELYDRAIDRAASEDIAVAYLFKMGSIHEDVLRDPKSAVEVYQRLLTRQAHNLGAIHALQRAAEQAGESRILVEAIDAEVELTKDRALEVRLRHRAAEVIADQLGELDAALPRLKSILKRAPADVATLRMLARVHRGLARWADLLIINEQQLGVTEDPVAKVALLVTMAGIAERELSDPVTAIKWYRKALDLDPRHSLAGAALARLLRSTGDYKGLAKVLAAELASHDDPRAFARIAVLLGEVHELHLGDAKAAVESYRRALDAVAGYRPAVDSLIRVHGHQGDFNELANVIALAAEDMSDRRLSLEAELMAATIRAERLDRGDEAAEAIQSIIERDAENLAAMRVLERLHVASGSARGLGEVLGRQADVLADGEARVAALVHRGRVLESLAEEEPVTELRVLCQSILTLDPINEWALGAMGRFAAATADSALTADVCNRLTKASRDDAVTAHHFAKLGAALSESNPGAALHAYKQALERAPDSLTAIRGMAAMAAKQGDAETMVVAYRLEGEWRRDPHATADLFVQSSSVLTRLGDAAGATGDAEKALATDPDHEAAARQVRALLLKAGNVERLTEQFSLAAHAATDLARKISLWRQVGELHADRRSDLGAAITAVTRALEAKPNDKVTVLQLAALHQRDAQHDEAAELLARAVSLDDGDLEAHLQLAGLYAEHLGEPNKAHRHIERVLKDRPLDRVALRLKLTLELKAKERDKARATSEQLLEAAGDDAEMRAWALVEIGRSELSAGDDKKAAEAFHNAVSLVGLSGEASKAYGKLLGEKEPWDRFADALKVYLKRGEGDPKDRASAYLELARVQHKLLDSAVDAFRTIETGIKRCGSLPELELRHAELLVATQQHADAVQAFQALTDRHPDHPEVWRGLVRVFQQLGQGAEASVAAGPLVVLGEASDAERGLAADRKLRPGAGRPGSFAAESIRSISAGADEDEEAVAALFHALADPLGKTFPIPFDMYGVRKSDRIKARTAHPVRQEVDALCAIFGVEDVDLYVHAGIGGAVTVELGDPPALMVPTSVAELPEAPRIFLLARPLAAIAAGLHPVLKLGPADTALVLAGAVRRLVPSFEDGEHDMERLAVVQERITPGWFGRNKVDEVVQRYYAQPVNAIQWAPSVSLTVTRAAAILCGDLEGAIAGLKLSGLAEADAEGSALVTSSPAVTDLLRHWMSDKALELRRLGGIV
jgi:tetratricopeptide (TPR) repeat protein